MAYLKTKIQLISVEGKEIAYRELGKGNSKLPLVMLVHLAATMDNWDPKLIDLLAEKQHIILLGLPGVGASQEIVRAHNNLVNRLILVGTGPRGGHGSLFQYGDRFADNLLNFLGE